LDCGPAGAEATTGRLRTADCGLRTENIFRAVSDKSARLMGFSRKLAAPNDMASTARGMLPAPVTTTTGLMRACGWTHRNTSSPVMSGGVVRDQSRVPDVDLERVPRRMASRARDTIVRRLSDPIRATMARARRGLNCAGSS